MYLSSTFRTHQSHNVGQDSSKALTTLQPVIHSMWRFTYPLRPSSQGTLVSTIRERRAAAPGELYNQWRYTLVLRQLFLLPASLVMPCWLFSENTLGFLLMSVCLFVCVYAQSIDLSRCSDADHRHLHVSSWIWTVYGWRGETEPISSSLTSF